MELNSYRANIMVREIVGVYQTLRTKRQNFTRAEKLSTRGIVEREADFIEA